MRPGQLEQQQGDGTAPRKLAQILRVLSRRIRSRIFLVSLCCSSLIGPTPFSFHSLESSENLYALAFLRGRAAFSAGSRNDRRITASTGAYASNETSSFSSPVVDATSSS